MSELPGQLAFSGLSEKEWERPEEKQQRKAHRNTVRAEMDRRKNNLEKVLDVLSDGMWHTNSELFVVGGFRYGARVAELRWGDNNRAPMVIHRHDRGEGLHAFRLDTTGATLADCVCPQCHIPKRGAVVTPAGRACPESMHGACDGDGGSDYP